ncbi:MAG TPA: c-type cytochrome [Micropepsaceae bacterium]|nr:c-type cytochrome [Micropepsaceae bacterium]
MSTLKVALVAILSACGAAALAADAGPPKLGKPISPADIAPWDISIMPDGTGLPPGSGTPAQGAPIFAAKCSACHGENGKGGIAAAVTAGPPRASLDGGKTIANFWPYATTVFDFIRRAMPYNAPHSLKDEEVYALTAYLLSLNKLIGDNDVMNAQTLPKVKMPNRDNFIIRFPDRI